MGNWDKNKLKNDFSFIAKKVKRTNSRKWWEIEIKTNKKTNLLLYAKRSK